VYLSEDFSHLFVQKVNAPGSPLPFGDPNRNRQDIKSTPSNDQYTITNVFRRNTMAVVDGKIDDTYGLSHHKPESESERKMHELWLARRKQEAFEWKSQQQVDLVMNRLALQKSRLESNALRRQETNTFMGIRSTKKGKLIQTIDEDNKKNVRYAPVHQPCRDDRGQQIANLQEIYSHLKPVDIDIKSPLKKTRSIIDREMKELNDADGMKSFHGSQSLHGSSVASIEAGDSILSVTSAFDGLGIAKEVRCRCPRYRS
jgi:hypothetical protein